jgi:excisionase family DNA binding protein
LIGKEQKGIIMSAIPNSISQNMRPKEVAKYLGIGLSTVWLYAKQGKLKPYRISERVTVFKRDEVDAFINESVS